MTTTAERHDLFLARLEKSRAAVWRVAQWLSGRGHYVQIAPTSFAPTADDWADHSDGGDLFVSQRVEIKHVGVNFTGRADWPFGDKFIVCGKGSHDRARPKPFAYVVISSNMSHVAMVLGSTAKQWRVEKRHDSKLNMQQDFYLCPIDLIAFSAIDKFST